eukprot:TRINITY_DN3370_c0_g2_i5.p1 TRINITY_DN3370_c0_g2~~TRINITY_DN3370_c0_g2_i5.p1  ORF type:complete len:223 (+),score=-12.87 TRINITY_DN3370_c0_g2_i5:38-670(+)
MLSELNINIIYSIQYINKSTTQESYHTIQTNQYFPRKKSQFYNTLPQFYNMQYEHLPRKPSYPFFPKFLNYVIEYYIKKKKKFNVLSLPQHSPACQKLSHRTTNMNLQYPIIKPNIIIPYNFGQKQTNLNSKRKSHYTHSSHITHVAHSYHIIIVLYFAYSNSQDGQITIVPFPLPTWQSIGQSQNIRNFQLQLHNYYLNEEQQQQSKQL